MANISLEDLAKLLEMYDVEEMSGVNIEGDIEIELSEGTGGSGVGLMLSQGITQAAMGLLDIARSAGYPVDSVLQMPAPMAGITRMGAQAAKLDSLIPAKFTVGKDKWTDRVEEVTIGATSSDG